MVKLAFLELLIASLLALRGLDCRQLALAQRLGSLQGPGTLPTAQAPVGWKESISK